MLEKVPEALGETPLKVHGKGGGVDRAGADLKSRVQMLDEIRQQPETLAATLASELRRVEKFRALMGRRKPRLVVIVARGTSDRTALVRTPI